VSLTLRVFENTVLRKIFGLEEDEVTGVEGVLYALEFHQILL
jgi:hypothetical protein